MGGYAHDFIGTAQKSGHVKTVSDEAGGVYTFVKEFIVQNATLNYYWPSYCRKVVIKMVAGGSGAQGNWAGSSSGRTGAIAQGTVLKQNLTANEQNGIDAIAIIGGAHGTTNAAHNGNDNGGNLSKFGTYLTANGGNNENGNYGNATTNLAGGAPNYCPGWRGSDHVGGIGNETWALHSKPNMGGIFGGEYSPGSAGGESAGGGGGNGSHGAVWVQEYA